MIMNEFGNQSLTLVGAGLSQFIRKLSLFVFMFVKHTYYNSCQAFFGVGIKLLVFRVGISFEFLL